MRKCFSVTEASSRSTNDIGRTFVSEALLNETIAEVLLQQDKGEITDSMLLELVRGCVYGDEETV